MFGVGKNYMKPKKIKRQLRQLSRRQINTIIKDINRQREVMHELVDQIIIIEEQEQNNNR